LDKAQNEGEIKCRPEIKPWCQSYQTFFFVKRRFFPFFAIKLGRFIEQAIFIIKQPLNLNNENRKTKKNEVW
jgi:hypothetical protein